MSEFSLKWYEHLDKIEKSIPKIPPPDWKYVWTYDVEESYRKIMNVLHRVEYGGNSLYFSKDIAQLKQYKRMCDGYNSCKRCIESDIANIKIYGLQHIEKYLEKNPNEETILIKILDSPDVSLKKEYEFQKWLADNINY